MMQESANPEEAASAVEQALEHVEPPPQLDQAWGTTVDKVESWSDTAIAALPNFVVAVIVLILFWFFSRLVRAALRRGLRHTPISRPVANLATTAASLIVFIAGFFFALGILGLDKTVTSLLAGVGIVGLALGFAFQDIAANFIAGVMISFRQPMKSGDLIETGEFFGVVEEINLRATLVRLNTGQIVFIPNKQIFENPIVNYSRMKRRRVDLSVGISYGDDLNRAKELATEAVESLELRQVERPVELFFTEFGDSSINFIVRFWIDFEDHQADYLAAKSAAIEAIKEIFDKNGITIPFPIRTLDFGIVGGRSLAEELPDAAKAGHTEPESSS
ncbi:MAG: mechanosensitive ion channel [Acidobacteriota bacterium]